MPSLTSLDVQFLNATDVGVQHVVRGCKSLEVLLLGGCTRLSNISLQLVVDHCQSRLRRPCSGVLDLRNEWCLSKGMCVRDVDG